MMKHIFTETGLDSLVTYLGNRMLTLWFRSTMPLMYPPSLRVWHDCSGSNGLWDTHNHCKCFIAAGSGDAAILVDLMIVEALCRLQNNPASP